MECLSGMVLCARLEVDTVAATVVVVVVLAALAAAAAFAAAKTAVRTPGYECAFANLGEEPPLGVLGGVLSRCKRLLISLAAAALTRVPDIFKVCNSFASVVESRMLPDRFKRGEEL